jgi:K+-transporting ATPase ATPase C chain
MRTHIRPAVVLFVGLSVITGIVYPVVTTVIAQLVFADKANGSLMPAADGASTGSRLIGQEFGTSDVTAAAAYAKWFWGRPSATGPVAYTALNQEAATGSSGSNLAATNPVVLERVRQRIAALDAADASVGVVRTVTAQGASDNAPAQRTRRVPIDLVTSSASGLDPHISPAGAAYQVSRVARARGMSEDAVWELVRQHTTGRTLGVLGEPVVHVLALNAALEQTEARSQ